MSFALRRTALQVSSTSAPSPCRCLPSSLPLRSFSSSSFASTSTPAATSAEEAVERPKYALPNGLLLHGIVTSTGKCAQTSTVSVERKQVDHKTLKEFKAHTKYLIHDPESLCVVGDQVSIRNCRPVSKRKRFELVEVLQGARERVENMAAAAVEEEEVKAKLEASA